MSWFSAECSSPLQVSLVWIYDSRGLLPFIFKDDLSTFALYIICWVFEYVINDKKYVFGTWMWVFTFSGVHTVLKIDPYSKTLSHTFKPFSHMHGRPELFNISSGNGIKQCFLFNPCGPCLWQLTKCRQLSRELKASEQASYVLLCATCQKGPPEFMCENDLILTG